MKKHIDFILISGLVFAVLISNSCRFFCDGRRLEQLRHSVLRLHILAESDGEYDQQLKLKVRDRLLESGIFEECSSLSDAEKTAEEKIPEIIRTAESVLRENGCELPVTAEIADVCFDTRVYGEITMPAGEYRALQVKIGSAQGKNWWCVMYPPLCLPAVCDEKNTDKNIDENIKENKYAEELFTDSELDILYNPEKYEIRFAVWDKIKGIYDKIFVKNDKNRKSA
ncbi:MAG: stage II sporulation protein R [Ruminococcus sp.]|nr:stage II sporulation protein R [Ruminococcus sp.]